MSFPYEMDVMYNSEQPSADGLGRTSFGSGGGSKGKRVWRSLTFQATKTPLYWSDEDGIHPVEGKDIETVPAYFTLDVSDPIYNEFFIENALPVFGCGYDNDSETNKFVWGGDIVGFWGIGDGPSGSVVATLTSTTPDTDYILDAKFVSKTLDIYSMSSESENYNIVGTLKINCYVNGQLNTDTSYVPVNINNDWYELYDVPIFLVSNASLMDTIFNPDVNLFEYSLPLYDNWLGYEEEPVGIYHRSKSLPELAAEIVEDMVDIVFTVDQLLDLLRNHLFTICVQNRTGIIWKIENDTLYVNDTYNLMMVFDKPLQD